MSCRAWRNEASCTTAVRPAAVSGPLGVPPGLDSGLRQSKYRAHPLNDGGDLQGHVGKRLPAGSWEYILDVGVFAAQRCEACGRRAWVERRPKESCPFCGGALRETEERRRETKAGFASRKDCQAALTRKLTTLAEHTYVLPSRLTLREFLLTVWLPAIESGLRQTTLGGYRTLVESHLVPQLGAVQLQSLNAAQINAHYARLLKEGRVHGAGGLSPNTVHHVHVVLHRALRDALKWGYLQTNVAQFADPPRASAQHRELPVWSEEQLHAFLGSVSEQWPDPLHRSTCYVSAIDGSGVRDGGAMSVSAKPCQTIVSGAGGRCPSELCGRRAL